MEYFKINSAKPEFKLFNGLVARPIEEREDGFVEVYIPAMDSFLLLLPDELEEDEFYSDELLDLDVLDDDSNKIGTVIAVEFTNGAQDNLRVRTSEGKEFLVPYVDEFILDVNLDENYIQIHLMDGLL